MSSSTATSDLAHEFFGEEAQRLLAVVGVALLELDDGHGVGACAFEIFDRDHVFEPGGAQKP